MPRGVKATAGDSAKPSQDLEALPRKELQALAKDLGVKANGKSADIIAGVRAAQSTAAAHEPPPPSVDDAAQAEQHVEEEEEEVQATRKVTRGKTKVPTAVKAAQATTGRAVRGKAKPDDAGSAREVEPAGDEQPQHAHSKAKASKQSRKPTTTTATTTTITTAAAATTTAVATATTRTKTGEAATPAAAKATDAASGKPMDEEVEGSVVVDVVHEAKAHGGKGRNGRGPKDRQQEQRAEEDEQQAKEEQAAVESVKPKATRSAVVATSTTASSSTTSSSSSSRRGRSTVAAADKAGERGAKGSVKKADAEASVKKADVELEEEKAVEHTVSEPAAEEQQREKVAVEVATTKVRRTKKAPVAAPVEEKAEVADEEEGPEPVVESQREPPTASAPPVKGRTGRGGAATAENTRAQAPPLPPPPRKYTEQDLSGQAQGGDGEAEPKQQQQQQQTKEGQEGEEEGEEPVPTAEELRGMSCVALRALAKRLGVKASSTRKADLINALCLSRACNSTSDPQPAATATGSAAGEGGEAGCSTATESGGSVGGAAGEGDEDQRVKQQPRRASLRLASQTDAAVRDQKDPDVAHTTPGGVDLAKQRRQELLREKKEARDLERKQRVLKKSEKNMRDIGLSKTPYHDTQKRKLLGRKDDPHKPWFRGFRVKHDNASRGGKGGDGDKKPSVAAVPRRIKAARRAQRIEKETQEACERLEQSFAKRYVRAEHREKIKDTGVRKAQQNRRDKFVSKSRSRRSVEYARNREAAMLTLDTDHTHAHTSNTYTTYANEGEAEGCVGLDGAKVGGRRSGGARRRSSVGSNKPLGPVKQGRGSLDGGNKAGGAAVAVHSGRGSDIGAAAGAEKPRSGGVRVRRSSGRSSTTTTTTTTTTTSSTKKHSTSSDHSGVKVVKKSPVGAIVKRRGSSIGGRSGRRSVEGGSRRKGGFVVDDMPSPPVC